MQNGMGLVSLLLTVGVLLMLFFVSISFLRRTVPPPEEGETVFTAVEEAQNAVDTINQRSDYSDYIE